MKDYRKANLGMPFEDYLKVVHGCYQRSGLACIHKVPTDFKPIRDYRGVIVDCKVEEKSCVDYLGRYRNIPVAVEAKHTEKSRISLGEVKPHQAMYLDDFTKEPEAVGLVAVSFNMERFFAVPWFFWNVARNAWENHRGRGKCQRITVKKYGWEWTTSGMASVSPEELHPEWEIKEDRRFGLPYLSIIDTMMKNLYKE